MHVAVVPSRQRSGEYSSVLVRQSYREDGKVKHRTLANLSKLPPAVVDTVRAMLRGEAVGPLSEAFDIVRSLPHGNVLAVLGQIRKLGLDHLFRLQPGHVGKVHILPGVELGLHNAGAYHLQPHTSVTPAQGQAGG